MNTPFDDYDSEESRGDPGGLQPPKVLSDAAEKVSAASNTSASETILKALVWGSVGTDHQGGAFKECGPGVRRISGAGVAYYPPPVGRLWTQIQEQHYVLAWEGDPRQARTLARLGEQLRAARSRRALTADSATLLDQLAEQLLMLAAELHQAGWSLGLIHPENVLIAESEEGHELVLVDLGFVWVGGIPAPWIEDNPHKTFWDSAPKTRQHAEPALSETGAEIKPRPAASVAADLRTLARLLASVLTGTTTLPLPRGPAPVWKALQAALDNHFPSARAFAAALKDTPPSGHFLRRPGPPTWLSAGIGAAALLLLTAIVVPFVLPKSAWWRSGDTPIVADLEAEQAWKHFCGDWSRRYEDLVARARQSKPENYDLERFQLGDQFQQLHDEMISEQKRYSEAISILSKEVQRCLTDAANQAKDLGLQ